MNKTNSNIGKLFVRQSYGLRYFSWAETRGRKHGFLPVGTIILIISDDDEFMYYCKEEKAFAFGKATRAPGNKNWLRDFFKPLV